MKYLKFTPYIYLIFAAYFIYDGITKSIANDPNQWMSYLISGLAVFMFFFRMRFAKKFEDQNKKP